MQQYELLCVLPGTLAEDEVTPVVQGVADVLAEQGAQSVTIEDMGKNRFAHPIQHIRYGYFRLFLFQAEPAAIPVIERKLRLGGGLLRALINKYDPALREASKQQREKQKDTYVGAEESPVEELIATPAPATVSKAEETEVADGEPKKIDMKEIDKKLDELLETDLKNV